MANKRTGRTPVKTIAVRSADEVPSGHPKRYLSAHGYVRLRWLVGVNVYAECYEHRLAAKFPEPHLHVHHIDGIKTNNEPENLLVLSAADHQRLHGSDPEWMSRQIKSRPPRTPLSEYPRCVRSGCDRAGQCINRTLCLKHYKAMKREETKANE